MTQELIQRLRGRAEAAEKANAEGNPLVERFSLLTEAADAIASLSRDLEEARDYLVHNVIEPSGATPLPSLIGICTQVDHITATLPISAPLKRDVLEAIEPFAEMGRGLTYDKDGVWRRRHHGRVTNMGQDIEITFNEGEPFERIAALASRLSSPDASSVTATSPPGNGGVDG